MSENTQGVGAASEQGESWTSEWGTVSAQSTSCANTQGTYCDTPVTVLRADALITKQRTVCNAELWFADGKIIAVGEQRKLGDPPANSVVKDLAGRVLMPGLANGHTHSAMTLQRGVDDDNGFMPWLAQVQAFEQHLTHDDVRAGLELAMLEMIATGTVAFADMYYWDYELLETVRRAGMRVAAAVAVTTPDASMFPGVTSRTGAAELAHTAKLAEHYANSGQIIVHYGPHAPYSVPREYFEQIIALSKQSGIPIHTHIAESPAETEQMLARTGLHPASYMRELGLFEVRTLAAHCVCLEPQEIADMVAAQVTLSHNPVSNLKLGNGVAMFPEWLAAGAKVSLGTDSVASNNSLDLFEEMKLATVLHRGARQDSTAVTSREVFNVATAGGARAIGFAQSGELEVGMQADIIALDVTGINAIPHDNLLSHIVFAASGRDVCEVWVAGRHLYSEGRYLTLDAADIKVRAAASAARLRELSGV
ncbi:amidohydrolase [Canibacter sp. lx-45]|uniref:amidohydrolase family protein n=1 Tax=Canibacter zhuwentaonis TaxID=2837491 RepID=UPI001BDC6B62|nr:amidohydrolase [Canibacter zhuwentaonis]MBT1035579.1 amidohydrolase [Canibacter zhuwentaonis]